MKLTAKMLVQATVDYSWLASNVLDVKSPLASSSQLSGLRLITAPYPSFHLGAFGGCLNHLAKHSR